MKLGLIGLLFLGVGAVGCAATDTEPEPESDVSESDLTGLAPGALGSLAFGETKTFRHPGGSPAYRSVTFQGSAGDQVDIWVRSSNGDPLAYLLKPTGGTLAKNDNATANETDAHLVAKLPVGGTFTIAFRDGKKRAADFTLTLAKQLASCAHPRISARVLVPSESNCSVTNDYASVVVGKHLYAVITPSAASCDHELTFVTDSGMAYGSLHLQQGSGDPGRESFYGSGNIGLPGDRAILSCSGNLSAHSLILGCPGVPRSCNMLLNY
jgi:hypothetical protein